MATTSSNQSGPKPAAGRRSTARRSTTRSSARSTTRRATASRRTSRTTTSTQPKSTVEQVQVLAERAVLVPVGASLLATDNLVSTVKGLATKYRTRTALEREIKRFERRGATARNRFERQVKRTRARFERQVRQRRSLVERTMRQNRRRFEREVRSVRKDLGKQSGIVGARVEKLVSDAQGLIGSAS
jgi:hypothetical protein